MIEKITDVPSGIVGMKAIGRLTKEDYTGAIEPMLDEAKRDGQRVRVLCELGRDFKGLTAGAAWEDAKLGLRSLGLFDGCAVVTDIDWIRESTKLASFLMPCPVRVFHEGERDKAASWLAELPHKGQGDAA